MGREFRNIGSKTVALTDGANIAIDPNKSHDFYVPVAASRNFLAPGEGYDGQKIVVNWKNTSASPITMTVAQGANGAFEFLGGANAFSATAAGVTDSFVARYHDGDQRWKILGFTGDFIFDNKNSKLGADVTMTNANTFYDAVSVSLEPGFWLVMAHASINRAATTLCQHTARISDGTNHYASTQASHPSQNPHAVGLAMSTIITITSTTTIKLQCASSVATSGIIKAATANNASGNNATQISALKVG